MGATEEIGWIGSSSSRPSRGPAAIRCEQRGMHRARTWSANVRVLPLEWPAGRDETLVSAHFPGPGRPRSRSHQAMRASTEADERRVPVAARRVPWPFILNSIAPRDFFAEGRDEVADRVIDAALDRSTKRRSGASCRVDT